MSTTIDLQAPAQAAPRKIWLIRLLPAAIRMRMRGDFSDFVRIARTAPAGLQAHIAWQRFVYLQRPEHIEALCVKNDKCYVKPLGNKALKRFLGEGLLTSEGQFHLRQRRMIQPAFHKKRIDAYAQCMVELSLAHTARWQEGPADINKEMMALTLSIIARTMFNARVEDDAKVVADALDVIMDYVERYGIDWIGKIFDALPLPSTRRLKKAIADLDAIIYRFIDEHCKAEEDSGDLLSMLLQAKAEEDGGAMSGVQLRDEALTLFLAGHETTAVLLSWTWMLLSQNPEVEAKLHEEVDRVLGGRPARLEDVDQLAYTRNVVTEAMRLYPPAYGFGRQAIEDNTIGPYEIRKGTMVFVSPLMIHRMPEWFPNPDAFDPDRWSPARAESIPKFAYCPFGGGSRKCIGDQFAWMEAVLILATVAQQWKMRVAPGHRPSADPRITLRPRGGMPMILEKRKNAPQALTQ